MKRILGLLLLLALAAFAARGLWAERGHLVAERSQIDARWARVDADIRHRADLIANLLALTSGFTKQNESGVKNVFEAHAAVLKSRTRLEEMKANTDLTAAIQALLANLDKNYPQLKPTVAFSELEDAIAAAENKLAVDRRDYNDAIQKYNTHLQLFPANIAAGLFGFKRDDAYFRTADGERRSSADVTPFVTASN